jgi:REP element-mobilizing transposase RayT
MVSHERELLFDDPVLRRVAGTMWQRIPRHFPHVELDEWVVMPNHVHGIIVITDAVGATHSTNVASASEAGCQDVKPRSAKRASGNASPLPTSSVPPTGPPSGSLGAIVGNFKSVTSRRINRIRHTPGVRVWQRNYYEHIVRNERELNRIRQYIRDNSARWPDDQENPDRLIRSGCGRAR